MSLLKFIKILSNSPNRVGIRNSKDYSPFGVELDGRTVSGGYRFGYQGSEKDNEFKGDGNSYTTEFRQLDPRLGRWLSVDPVIQPWQSSYCSMDDNPILRKDIRGDITDKEERKLRRESKKIQRENLRLHSKEEKWAKNYAKEFNGDVQENKDERGSTTYGVKISKITSNKEIKVSYHSSPYRKIINSNNTRLSQIKNSVDGYYYHEGEMMGISMSISYDMYFCGGISYSTDLVMVGGETCLGDTFGGGLGFGGGSGVDFQFIYCTKSGRYRAKDLQEGDGWEFAASFGPLSYSRSGDRNDTQFHWNGDISTGHSFDATGLMSKKNWLELYQAMAFGSINSLKNNYSVKYEWNQSRIWGNW